MEHLFNKESFNVNHINVELSETLKVKISGFKHTGKILHVYVSQVLTDQEYQELKTSVENHNGASDSNLRIYRVLPTDQNPLIADFSILGFRKVSPSYERGRKTRSLYKCTENDEVIVEKIFEDVRDENGTLSGLQITFNWYNEDGEIGLTKTQQVKSFNKYQAETQERQRRERQIDYLVAGAKGTPIEANINMVFDFLYDEVMLYKEKANPQPMVDKLNSIQYIANASTQQELENNGMWYILNAVALPRVDDPNKYIYVIQSIKYQIGVMTLAEIEAENV